MRQAFNPDRLPHMSDGELVQAYADVMVAFDATENVAKKNRLVDHQSEIFREMRSRGRERPLLQELAQHQNEVVRSWAQSKLKWLDNPPPPSPPRHPLRAELLWQLENLPPPAMTKEKIAERLKDAVPKDCDRIMGLALPAIGLWPQRPSAKDFPTSSRLGGVPLAPASWQWPIEDDEPLVFIAQINCSELHGLPGSEVLPSLGLLSFFCRAPRRHGLSF